MGRFESEVTGGARIAGGKLTLDGKENINKRENRSSTSTATWSMSLAITSFLIATAVFCANYAFE